MCEHSKYKVWLLRNENSLSHRLHKSDTPKHLDGNAKALKQENIYQICTKRRDTCSMNEQSFWKD